jgi:hypothetical protein
MLTSHISLRIMCADELAGDPSPDACVELAFGPVRPPGEPGVVMFPEPLRLTPADLLRLHMESHLTLGEIRVEVVQAEISWRQHLGRWHEEGRVAVASREPDTALLVRVLEGLRKQVLVPV